MRGSLRRSKRGGGVGARGEIAPPRGTGGGFILMEVMVATAIFALAILALAHSVEVGLQAGIFQKQDSRARRALLNTMRELEAMAQPYADNPGGVEMKGEFEGMRMVQRVVPLKLVDQRKQSVEGMLEVTLEVSWMAGSRPASRELKFYAYPTGL
jgi:hypothetical protein